MFVCLFVFALKKRANVSMCFSPWGNYRDKCWRTKLVTRISFCLWQSKLKISGGDINTETKTELTGQLLFMHLAHKRHTQASGLRHWLKPLLKIQILKL